MSIQETAGRLFTIEYTVALFISPGQCRPGQSSAVQSRPVPSSAVQCRPVQSILALRISANGLLPLPPNPPLPLSPALPSTTTTGESRGWEIHPVTPRVTLTQQLSCVSIPKSATLTKCTFPPLERRQNPYHPINIERVAKAKKAAARPKRALFFLSFVHPRLPLLTAMLGRYDSLSWIIMSAIIAAMLSAMIRTALSSHRSFLNLIRNGTAESALRSTIITLSKRQRPRKEGRKETEKMTTRGDACTIFVLGRKKTYVRTYTHA